MKVLFVYFSTAARTAYPLGLSVLANYTKGRGHTVEVFDTTFYKEFIGSKRDILREKLGFYKKVKNPVEIKYLESSLTDDLKKKIEEFSPDIIGFSILSVHYKYSLSIARFIKKFFPSIPIIVGGLHPTLSPDEMINEPSVDMVCIGEGEYAFAELLERMGEKKDITSVRGIWVKQGGKAYKNDMGRLIDMEDLPVNDWDFFSRQHLYSPLDGRMYYTGPVEFSRGCPYSCAYCSIHYLKELVRPQKYLRRKSVEQTISELAYLKNKFNIEMFYFQDETFLSNDIETLRIFAEEYKKNVDIPFHGLAFPLAVTEEKVKLVEGIGCYQISMGIECGNEDFRRDVLNRKVSNKQIVEAFDLFHRSGVFPSAFGMLGLPYETRELVFETIEMFRRCKPRNFAIGIYKPYLGSPLREVCIKEGFYDPTGDNYIYPDNTTVLSMPQFPKEEIEGLHRTFYLYTKLPREKFPLIKQAERDDRIMEELVMECRSMDS